MTNEAVEAALRDAAYTSVLWRRLDHPGHDAARLSAGADGASLDGAAVFSDSGRTYKVGYRVVCDARWRTCAVRVTGWCGAGDIALTIAVDAERRWTVNGVECAAVQGCDDVDLSFTPATNVLPIRRLDLAIGAGAEVRAAWLRVPELTLEPLDQTYARVAASQYRYEAPARAFVALLDTNQAGMVTTYPSLWQAEPDGHAAPAATPHLFGDGRLSYIQIPAAQGHASGAFYARVFGWKVRGGSDAHLSFADATGDMIGAFVAGRVVAREPGVLAYIYVHGIDAALERVTAAGGEVVTPPYAEGALWVATFRDPTGNVIGVWQHGPR